MLLNHKALTNKQPAMSTIRQRANSIRDNVPDVRKIGGRPFVSPKSLPQAFRDAVIENGATSCICKKNRHKHHGNTELQKR